MASYMTGRSYILAREFTEHDLCWLEYWTGRTGAAGFPSRSCFQSDAYHFTTARAAYECAQTHKDLKDSDQWRVLQAKPRQALRA